MDLRPPATGGARSGGSSCRVSSPDIGGVQQSGDAVALLGGQRRERVDDGPDMLGEHRGGALQGRGVGDAPRQPLCSPAARLPPGGWQRFG